MNLFLFVIGCVIGSIVGVVIVTLLERLMKKINDYLNEMNRPCKVVIYNYDLSVVDRLEVGYSEALRLQSRLKIGRYCTITKINS